MEQHVSLTRAPANSGWLWSAPTIPGRTSFAAGTERVVSRPARASFRASHVRTLLKFFHRFFVLSDLCAFRDMDMASHNVVLQNCSANIAIAFGYPKDPNV